MLRVKIYFVGFFLWFFSVVLLPAVSFAVPLTDTSNPHNMSSSATHSSPKAQPVAGGGTDQICVFCHTPHSATPASTLWSRPDPSTASFPLYANDLVIKGQLGAPAGAQNRSQYKDDGSVAYPNGASRMCLSCHDGVTAIGILQDNTSIAMVGGQNLVTGQAVIDLSSSHPISFVYDNAVLADIVSVRGATYQLPSLADDIDTPLDGNDRMQCTTCHDPHEDTRAETAPENLPFWRNTVIVGTTLYDDVCNSCHVGATPGTPPHLP